MRLPDLQVVAIQGGSPKSQGFVFSLRIYHASVLFYNQLIQEETCQKGQMYPTSLYAPGASRRLSVVVRETLSEEGTIGGLYTQLLGNCTDLHTTIGLGIVQNTH